MHVSRRQFIQLTASTVGATSLTALGFAPDRVLADVREFKLAHTSQTRNTCPYCSVELRASSCTRSATSRRTRSRRSSTSRAIPITR